MQIESLKIFCDVVRLGSFSRGAEANGVLQSAASQAVHHFQKRLGMPLINPSRQPGKLTRKSKLCYDGCRKVLAQYRDMKEQVFRRRADRTRWCGWRRFTRSI